MSIRFIVLLQAIAFIVLNGCSKVSSKIVVGSESELKQIITTSDVDTVYIKNGQYSQFKIEITKSGTKTNPLVIAAETPGEVIFDDNTCIVVSGNHVELSGIFFKDGLEANGMDGGQPVIDIKGDYCRVTECAFFQCHNRACIASLYQKEEDRMPQYTRIDHCYFADNFGWRLYLDLGQRVPGDDLKYAMYYRVDHCYFSTPFKLGANTGSAMRIGLGQLGYGRCVIDNNLFERQNGEVELIENKSHENVYLFNTFKNCESQMSFRQGHQTVFLHNHFIGDDPDRKCGGLGMWMDRHVVAGNYFSFPYGSYVPLNSNMKQREDRFPPAVIRFNSGCKNFIEDGNPVGHMAAQHITFANNFIYNSPDYAIDFSHNYDGMYERYFQAVGYETSGSFENKIYNNTFVRNEDAKVEMFYDKVSSGVTSGEWKNNRMKGYLNSSGGRNMLSIEETQKDKETVKISNVEVFQAWMCKTPGLTEQIDLEKLANSAVASIKTEGQIQVVMHTQPQSFSGVGPEWLQENPSEFAKYGKYTKELEQEIRKNIVH
ncbi:hypothetical protein EYV94_01570 [Puteibacter caeruleilacunae]|nr:hypothetical protein EYV94_01570 [Puteibacter caeruleilacunae]